MSDGAAKDLSRAGHNLCGMSMELEQRSVKDKHHQYAESFELAHSLLLHQIASRNESPLLVSLV